MVFDPHKDKKLRLNLKHYPDFFFHLPYKIIFRDKNARPCFISEKIFRSLRESVFSPKALLYLSLHIGGV